MPSTSTAINAALAAAMTSVLCACGKQPEQTAGNETAPTPATSTESRAAAVPAAAATAAASAPPLTTSNNAAFAAVDSKQVENAAHSVADCSLDRVNDFPAQHSSTFSRSDKPLLAGGRAIRMPSRLRLHCRSSSRATAITR